MRGRSPSGFRQSSRCRNMWPFGHGARSDRRTVGARHVTHDERFQARFRSIRRHLFSPSSTNQVKLAKYGSWNQHLAKPIDSDRANPSSTHQVKAGPYGSPSTCRILVRHSPVRQVAHQFWGRALIVRNQRASLYCLFNQPRCSRAIPCFDPKTLPDRGVCRGLLADVSKAGVPVNRTNSVRLVHLGQGSRSKEHDPRMVRCRLRERRGQLVDFGLKDNFVPATATFFADADTTH